MYNPLQETPSSDWRVSLSTLNEGPLDRVLRALGSYPELNLVYLFGSQVDGSAGGQSDYDFAVLVDDMRHVSALRARLAHDLGVSLDTDRVDVVVLNRAAVELAHAVIAQGVLIYRRDEATLIEYEADVMGRYGDYLPVLRAQRRDIIRGGEYAARVQRNRAALRRTQRTLGEIRVAKGEVPR